MAKLEPLDPDQVRRFGFHGLSCEFLISGPPRYADLHGGYRKKHAGDSRPHLRAPGVSWLRLFPRNERNTAIISRAASPVTVRVMTTSEELMSARHTGHLMRHQKGIIHEIQ